MSDTVAAKPASKYGAPRQKVPPFARYEGTSAWRKYRHRVREYNRYQAALKAKTAGSPPNQ